MPHPNREAMQHEHDGLPIHFKRVSHESKGTKNDINAHLRGKQFAHDTINDRLATPLNISREQKDIQENLPDVSEITFPPYDEWREHAFKRATENIQDLISLLLKKSELSIRISDNEENIIKDRKAMTEVDKVLAQIEIPF